MASLPVPTDMGFACPVCETPQMDATHLANHLAFTALLGDKAHEEWLDDHVPEWEGLDESALSERVADHAKEAAFPQVFEDTTGDSEHDESPTERSGALFQDDHAHGHAGHDHGRGTPPQHDAETEEVLEEARELTQKMLESEDEDDEA